MTDDILSQEELDALLEGGIETDETNSDSEKDEIEEENSNKENEEILDEYEVSDFLTEIEIDALGEIGNISMGTAATTLSKLLDKKVNITTPTVSITTPSELANEYRAPLIAVDVSYKSGLKGSNIMILRTDDAKVISDLMMGKEDVDIDREINEMDLSAVSEAMNQMMGSSATSMSEMLGKKIDIKPPKSEEITFSEDKEAFKVLKNGDGILKISFRMVIGDYIDSNIMQLLPVEFGKEMVASIIEKQKKSQENNMGNIDESIMEKEKKDISSDATKNQSEEKLEKPVDLVDSNNLKMDVDKMRSKSRKHRIEEDSIKDKVVINKPKFKTFDETKEVRNGLEIDLVGDIPVEITVELGRTDKKIGEILEMGIGTVIELDKLVGEPLNMFANGKYIASGEVVVIDDSFGVRITEIDSVNQNLI